MQITRFITSTNEWENYLYCWPLVAQVTKKLFGCETTLGFITTRSNEDPLVNYFRKFGEVQIFAPIDGIPSANQAKVTRLYLASSKPYGDVCCINDVDILPLQNNFLIGCLSEAPEDSLVAIGANAFLNTVDSGKFPMIYTTAKSLTFLELINPMRMPYSVLLNSWKGLRKFDGREDLSNDSKAFSDESLLRLLIDRWDGKDRIFHRDRNFIGYRAVERIDRARWHIDRNKLENMWYIDAHLPRPLNRKYFMVREIAYFFGVDDYIGEIDALKK